MLKKVMAMLASKYLAIKVRIRAIETHLMIQSLLLRDKKMVRHLFRQRKCFNLSNKVKDEDDEYQSESDGALIDDSIATTPLINSSIATSPASVIQVAEEAEDKMETEDDDEYPDLTQAVLEDREDGSASVIEMMKNVKEGQGKKFILEDDIDQVADLFIQRFHQQIRLQRSQSEGSLSHYPL